jgi:hypothetical protein
MRPIREWPMTTWLVIVGLTIILLLGGVIVYVVFTPSVFKPGVTPFDPGAPGIGLPPELIGSPLFPQSEVEGIPLDQIQGLDTLNLTDDTARGGITQEVTLTDFSTSFVSLDPSGQGLNFYDPNQNKFFRVDGDGVVSSIDSPFFAEIENVTYAPNASDTVLEFPDGTNVVFNLDTQEQVTLPKHWEEFDFSPSSEKLAFKSMALDPDQRWLAVTDKTGGSARQIEPLGENEDIVDVDWSPNNQVVATYSRPTGLTNSNLFFVGFNGENFPLSKLEGLNFEGSWNPNGEKLLYSVAHDKTDFRPTLWIVDGKSDSLGSGRTSTPLNTWSHKCTFPNETTAYCGVPKNLPQGAGIIPSVADDIPDEIYQVDLETGRTSLLAIPVANINVQAITQSDDGSELFIHDRFTNQIKKISL